MTTQTVRKVEQAAAEAYDRVPYESYTYPLTHSDHLAAVGQLFGLTPPDFKKARVLELGCASGTNLFPMAFAYPEASFTGIDISKEQIRQANVHKDALKLKNIAFHQGDILEFITSDNKGAYDYIICHGILSWVPALVQEGIFKIFEHCLSPKGLAVISYNTLPGWNMVRSFRDMMLYHTKNFQNPGDRVQQSRALLDFLAESVPENRVGYRAIIEDERKILKDANDTYLYHDHLETDNTQFYFHEFMAKASAHKLSYVGDADLKSMFVENLPEKARQTLGQLKDIGVQEQYMDFITNRRFRMSILCRADQPMNRSLDNNQIMDFYLTANFRPKTKNSDPTKEIVFETPQGNGLTSHDPATGALFLELSESSPRPVAAKELVARAQKRLKADTDEKIRQVLIANGLQLVFRGYINIYLNDVPIVKEVREKPVAHPLSRYQASLSGRSSVTTAVRGTTNTDLSSKVIIYSLDGTRTSKDIIDLLTTQAQAGKLSLSKEGRPVTDAKEIRVEIEGLVARVLRNLADQGLLIG